MDDAQPKRQGLPVGAWIAIGCLGLITVGCGAVFVWFKPLFDAGMGFQQEMEMAKATSIEDANRMVDLAWDLGMVLDDPAGARGKWLVLEGTVWEVESGGQPAFIPQDQEGAVFNLSDTVGDPLRVLMIFTESEAPAEGEMVRVVGFIPEADIVGVMMDRFVPEEEMESMEEISILMMFAVQVEVL